MFQLITVLWNNRHGHGQGQDCLQEVCSFVRSIKCKSNRLSAKVPNLHNQVAVFFTKFVTPYHYCKKNIILTQQISFCFQVENYQNYIFSDHILIIWMVYPRLPAPMASFCNKIKMISCKFKSPSTSSTLQDVYINCQQISSPLFQQTSISSVIFAETFPNFLVFDSYYFERTLL